jgi:hypothetical protein
MAQYQIVSISFSNQFQKEKRLWQSLLQNANCVKGQSNKVGGIEDWKIEGSGFRDSRLKGSRVQRFTDQEKRE